MTPDVFTALLEVQGYHLSQDWKPYPGPTLGGESLPVGQYGVVSGKAVVVKASETQILIAVVSLGELSGIGSLSLLPGGEDVPLWAKAAMRTTVGQG